MLTADRGYGRPSFMDQVKKLGLSFVVVLPNKILFCNPLVALSTLSEKDAVENGEETTENFGYRKNEFIMDENGLSVTTQCTL